MSKQTAVEWLGNEITNRITRRNPHDTIIIQTLGEVLIELIEQAKEMEKEQIIDAYLIPLSNEYWFQKDEILNQESEKYYNETYGGDK